MANNMTAVQCVECGKPYLVRGVQMMTERNEATGLELTYYRCPHCGFKYSIALTDSYIRELMARRRKLYEKYRVTPKPRTWKAIEKLDADIRDRMDRLNKRGKYAPTNAAVQAAE